MKIKNNEIVFLIRSYNESKRVWKVINSILSKWYKNILLIDDWSTDSTYKLLKNYDLIYLKHPFNRWWWAALETWFEYLRRYWKSKWFNYVVTFDADWQHKIEDLKKFVDKFESDETLDVVFGSRFIKKTNSNVPFFRKLILKGWIIFTKLISWIYLTDSHNGYRMIKLSSLKKINITMSWMEYASELIEQVSINDLKFKEVPVDIYYDKYTLKKWQRFGWPFRIVYKMIFSKFFK